MYYDNKFRFYMEEYGTKIVVGIVCLFLIASSLFVYFKINKAKPNTVVVESSVEENVENNGEQNITNDDSILSEELKKLKTGEKATVKVATVDDKGVLVILSGDTRIKAKLIGTDFSEYMPDTIYMIDKEIAGSYVDVSFDETKVSNGYAMIYVYTNETTLYNAKLLKEGKLQFDSSIDKKALKYNDLAESQAFAKQTLAGIWGEM